MRIYDPRIGKFLSVDPIAANYPMLTPYQFASNSPIQAIDLDGLEGSWAGALQGVPASERDNFNKGLREGHKKGLIAVTTASAVAADLYFTGGKVSQFFLGAQFFSGFNDNKAKTVEGRIQQEKDSRNAISQAVFAYGTGVALGKIFWGVGELANVTGRRFNLAKSFYLAEGYPEGRAANHMGGIDFSKPVQTATYKKGTVLEQWLQVDKTTGATVPGDYYTLPGADPTKLGISLEGRVKVNIVLGEDTKFLKSTTSDIQDTWSKPGQVISTKGGETQLFKTGVKKN
jgi:Bacterial toxin 46